MPQKRDVPRICERCGGDFFTWAAEVKRGNGKFCNRSCSKTRLNTPRGPIRSTLASMRDRCNNPNNAQWEDYGGRGIRVCAGWDSADQFAADVGEKPSQAHSIDRKDNDGNYSCGKCEECLANGWPMNVRWATRTEQNRNARRNVLLTYDNRTQCVSAWAEEIGLNSATVLARHRRGDDIEIVLSPSLYPTGRGNGYRPPPRLK